jgi:hypothetical protein
MNMLSIDWDFFPWSGEHLDMIEVAVMQDSGARKLTNVRASLVFDWLHGPITAGMGESIWRLRFQNALNTFDIDLETVCNIRPHVGCIPPATFITEVEHRFNLGEADVWFGDDHGHAYRVAQAARRKATVAGDNQVRIVHFDAHHDLGYSNTDIEHRLFGEVKKKPPACEDWLFWALHDGLVDEVVLVYPDWRGVELDEDRDTMAWMNGYWNRVRSVTWSKFLAMQKRSKKGLLVSDVFLARSSGWTPPWLDEAFLDLVHAFDRFPFCCDRDGTHISKEDASVPRGWDREAAVKAAGVEWDLAMQHYRKLTDKLGEAERA